MAPTRPSIMSLGQTASASASTCETAVRAISSRVASLSTSPSRTTPQCPWLVYSQRQTSVSRESSGKRGRSEYTSHGHCGVVRDGEVDNDATLELIARTAVSHVEAGADAVCPSDM